MTPTSIDIIRFIALSVPRSIWPILRSSRLEQPNALVVPSQPVISWQKKRDKKREITGGRIKTASIGVIDKHTRARYDLFRRAIMLFNRPSIAVSN